MGKFWIRDHPATKEPSDKQDEHNKFVADLTKEYANKDIGKRNDGGGGRRVIIFVGYAENNQHVEVATKEKDNGYWDKVLLSRRRE